MFESEEGTGEPYVPFSPVPILLGKDLQPAADTLLKNRAGISAVRWGQVNFAVPLILSGESNQPFSLLGKQQGE